MVSTAVDVYYLPGLLLQYRSMWTLAAYIHWTSFARANRVNQLKTDLMRPLPLRGNYSRLDRLRALFPDGVVWLGVGKGAGAPDRLPALMRDLAIGLGKVIGGVGAPEAGEDGGSYVKDGAWGRL